MGNVYIQRLKQTFDLKMSFLWKRKSNPIDCSVEKIINRNGEETSNEDRISALELCNVVLRSKDGPNLCLKAIMNFLNNSNNKIVLKAIWLLDTVVNGCGDPFYAAIGTSYFC